MSLYKCQAVQPFHSGGVPCTNIHTRQTHKKTKNRGAQNITHRQCDFILPINYLYHKIEYSCCYIKNESLKPFTCNRRLYRLSFYFIILLLLYRLCVCVHVSGLLASVPTIQEEAEPPMTDESQNSSGPGGRKHTKYSFSPLRMKQMSS